MISRRGVRQNDNRLASHVVHGPPRNLKSAETRFRFTRARL
jgi:hypothetical protein